MNKVSTLTYTKDDEVATATDANGHTTTYTYNGFGEVVSTQSLDAGTHTSTYDAAGAIATRTDPRGVTATFTDDVLGRITQVDYAGSGFTPETQVFTYDTCTNGVGRVCAITDATGSTSFTYDLWGRLASQSFVPAGTSLNLQVSFTYDLAGRLVSQTYPSGAVLDTTYANGRVQALEWDNQAILSQAAYRPLHGAPTSWQWGQGGAVAFGYDLNGRPTQIVDLSTRQYGWDAADRLLTITDPNDATRNQTYTYDATSRLLTANLAWLGSLWTYTYDSNGNRLTDKLGAAQTSYGVLAYSNRLSSITPPAQPAQPWTLDAAGNLVDDGAGRTFTYDAKGRMATASHLGNAASYGVNALGLRAQKSVNSVVEYAVYDPARRLIGRYDATGQALEELVYLESSFRAVATIRGTSIHPILSDHLGTPRAVLSTTGQPVWLWDAKEAFGNQAPNDTVSGTLFTFDLRFPGQRFDSETGLFHNGFRDYDPASGRYVQADPIGLGGGWNRFGYGSSSPLLNVDAWGLKFGKGWDSPNARLAVAYLSLSPTAAHLLADVESSPMTVHLEEDVDLPLSQYTLRGDIPFLGQLGILRLPRTVLWNPGSAKFCETHNAGMSAALALIHELAHFRSDDLGLNGGLMERQVPPHRANGLEDYAMNIERIVARELGEHVRDNYFIGTPAHIHPEHIIRIPVSSPIELPRGK